MFSRIIFSLIFLFSFIICGSLKEIPSYINVCKRDPEAVDECVKQSIVSLKPYLITGIPELEVPSIDPFYIPEIVIVDDSANPIHAIGKNVKVTGAGNFSIQSLSFNLDEFTVRARVTIPELYFEGEYEVDVQILLLPLKGKGTLTAESRKVDVDILLRSEPVHKDGQEYVKFVNLKTDIKVKDYKIKLEGLFKGDKVLEKATNEAINQNRDEFFKATKPYLEKSIEKLLLGVANKVVDGLTLDQLLPAP